jgi:hypothetical protein
MIRIHSNPGWSLVGGVRLSVCDMGRDEAGGPRLKGREFGAIPGLRGETWGTHKLAAD